MGGGSATAKTASYVLVAADAGTTVIMNSASSTTITVNTGLFSAGDTVLIQNIGAGTCTVTAGTATVSTAGSLALTQYEAGILYFTATGTALFHDYVQAASNPLTTTGDMIYSSSGSTQARLGIGSTSQVLTVSGGIPAWATPASSSPASGVATVATDQSTTSSSYTDLATSGPAVTLTTGTKVLVIVSAYEYQSTSGGQARMSYAVSGATTIAALDSTALTLRRIDDTNIRASAVSRITVTAGSNTFTAKYRTTGTGTANFLDREICVIDLGS
jgi:hypothetical protein